MQPIIRLMNKFAEDYYRNLTSIVNSIRATSAEGDELGFYNGIEKAGNLIKSCADSGNKIMFIGNGASASISSHMATDFFKNGGIRAIAFNDSSLLTCISNDFGYKYVFSKPIEAFADKEDIVFAISSSGESENILEGVKTARSRGCNVITLSGFREDNGLSTTGDINFYVPSQKYGPVEVIHHSICHCVLDMIISHKNRQK